MLLMVTVLLFRGPGTAMFLGLRPVALAAYSFQTTHLWQGAHFFRIG
jgi:hypothetical protein